MTVDRRRIELAEPIKQLGTYPIVVQVGRDIRATVELSVEAPSDRCGDGSARCRRGPSSRRARRAALAP